MNRNALCCAGCLLVVSLTAAAATAGEVSAEVDAAKTIAYLLGCQKPNGAFGPADQSHSDLAWNYPAVAALTVLKADIPRREDCLASGQWAAFRTPDAHRTNLHWDLYQKVQLQRLLVAEGQPLSVFAGQRPGGKPIPLDRDWKLEYQDRKGQYYAPYGLGVFCDVSSLWYMTSALRGLGGRIENVDTVREFLAARQAPTGGFVDAYQPDGPVADADAHLVITSEAVLTIAALGEPVPNAAACAAWIRSCQLPDGGFRYSPVRTDASNRADVWYTWSALHALKVLDSKPADAEKCIAWLNSLQNPDGGFGDRPGWNSRLYSTFYAVESLAMLCGDARSGIRPKHVVRPEEEIAEGKYSVFHAHLKAPAVEADSPSTMVDGVQAMGVNLLGVKATEVAEARRHAAAKGYRLEVVACPENYAHTLRWLGGHPADHVSNWLIPPEMNDQQRQAFAAADAAGRRGLPWAEFRQQVIAPMHAMGSLVYPEMDYSMVNAYMVYDDGLDGQPGFSALIAGLGWPAWDWIRHFPYRERWVGKLPMMADGDAHGDLSAWRGRLEKQRILYLAEDHRLPAFAEACRQGRAVCVIRDETASTGIVYYGTSAAVRYLKRHEAEWKWW
jgi:prenyltransferase beta subunit